MNDEGTIKTFEDETASSETQRQNIPTSEGDFAFLTREQRIDAVAKLMQTWAHRLISQSSHLTAEHEHVE